MASTNKRVVLIPTYNEAKNVDELIKRIAFVDPCLDMLIIDDNSPDGTADSVSQLQNDLPNIYLLHRPSKEGLGVAYLEGYKWALERDYEIIAQMDGDLSHRPEDLPRFFSELNSCDVVVGSRYISGGCTENWGFWRNFLSQTGNVYARMILGTKFSDFTSGYRAFMRSVPERLFVHSLLSKGYAFQIEVLARAHYAGFCIREIPICFQERSHGKTKFHADIVWEALYNTLKLRFHKNRL